jgi:wyosine [tRNA(Phe)-imidazoG37] synthetase (radical SAM superfamily)
MISFGPVPSRRLGKSLGINNIIAPKTCSYGCVYCQVGLTNRRSIKRDTFFEPEIIYKNVIRHLRILKQDNYPDYITIVSNGEPTLDINLGKTIKLLKKTDIPVAVITNASLLSDESVREDLQPADWISLKVDAADKMTWAKINRPDKKLDFNNYLRNIILFSGQYTGHLNTESMIIDRLNDSPEHLTRLAGIIRKINPQRAYLSVPVRPPAEKWVKMPDTEKLNIAWQILEKHFISTELLTGFEGSETGSTGNIYEDILNIASVHPLREDTLLKLLEKDNADFHVVESLMKQKLIRSTLYEGKRFFLREYHLNE